MSLFLLNKKLNLFLFVILGSFCLISPLKTELIKTYEDLGLDYLEREKDDLYILGPGDTLAIRFLEEFSFNINFENSNETLENKLFGFNDYEIDGSGFLYLPRIKKTYVEGLTVSELTNLLDKRYKEFIREPKIQIDLIGFRPISVYLDGEVENAGLYVLSGFGVESNNQLKEFDVRFQNNNLDILPQKKNLTYQKQFPKLFDLIRKAGGITIYSDLSNIEIIRDNPISKGGGKIKTTVNLLDVIDKNDKTQNIRILDGDKIVVKRSSDGLNEQIRKAIASNLNPKFINILIVGRVENQGKISVSKSTSLNDAISMAGGLKALRGQVSLTRFKTNGEIERRNFRFSQRAERGSYKNPYLQTGDVINVGKGTIVKSAEVVGEITQPFLGIYTTYSIFEDILN